MFEYSLIRKSTARISFLKDLGPIGLCFFSNEKIEPASHLYFCLYSSGMADPIKLIGKVVWCKETASSLWIPRYRVGLEFYDGDSAQYARLTDLLRAKGAGTKI